MRFLSDPVDPTHSGQRSETHRHPHPTGDVPEIQWIDRTTSVSDRSDVTFRLIASIVRTQRTLLADELSTAIRVLFDDLSISEFDDQRSFRFRKFEFLVQSTNRRFRFTPFLEPNKCT